MKYKHSTFFLILVVSSYYGMTQVGPNYIRTKNSALQAEEGLKFDIIGGGAVLSSATNGSGQAQGKGSTGISFYKQGKCQGSVIYTLGTNEDIDFTGSISNGASLLIPGNGGQSIQIDYRQYNVFKKSKLGFNFSFTGAAGSWKFNNTSFNANVASAKLQVSYLFLDPPATDKLNIMFSGDLGITYRGIFGDASSENDFKKAIFGTANSNFLGIELNADLWLNDTRLFFSFPMIFGDKVKGLTNGQFIIGAAVSGKVLKDIF